MRMKEDVVKHVEIMSKILKVDVEVVDDQMNLIAGKFNRYVHQNEDGSTFIGKVYQAVIETAQKQIIHNPGKHPLCKGCAQEDSCEEKLEMSTPILVDNQVVGVIGFVCYTDEQEAYIHTTLDMFTDFLDQMAGLISLKATQLIESERVITRTSMLNDIVDKVDEGVIIFDKQRKIQKMNAVAYKMLNIKDTDSVLDNIKLIKQKESHLGKAAYLIHYNDNEYMVTGTLFDFFNDIYNEVFIFRDLDSIKANVIAMMSSNEKIGLDRILGASNAVKSLKSQIRSVASTQSSVMIVGESGTGKELVARALHEESERSDKPFVAINCGAIPENLLESELFGYVKGAFSGADPRGKIGKFELAHTGTIFLDEIGDMPLHIQVKLLRVLEEREIVRLGANKPFGMDVRVIAATNKNLEKLIDERAFREDLFYRLNVIPLRTSPLRRREGDIKLLTDHFVHRYCEIFSKKVGCIEDNFYSCLEDYSWPGNIRELQNVIEYVINIIDPNGKLSIKQLPDKIKTNPAQSKDIELNLECVEKNVICKAIEKYGFDGPSKRIVADELGIGIATLYRKLKKYKIEYELEA